MIHEIMIRNFKCFEDQLLDVSPLTVLTGLNGMGKSTVIQSLLLLRQSHLQGTLFTKGLSLNGELVYIGTGHDALNQSATVEEIEFLLASKGNSLTLKFGYDKDADLLPLKSASGVSDSSLFTDQFHYLAADRIGPSNVFKTSNYQVRELKQIGSHGEYAVHFLSIFGDSPVPNSNLHHPKANSNLLLNQVDAWLSDISPGTKLVVKEHTDMDLVSLRYQFRGAKDLSNPFRSTNVGFGLTYTLPVILAILAAEPGTLLLIENPEAHLHPRGQSRMGELLSLAAASGVQLIIETHSDHIVNGIRLAVHRGLVEYQDIALHYFERFETETKLYHSVDTIEIDSRGRLSHWPEGFFDEWDKSLDALLEPPAKE